MSIFRRYTLRTLRKNPVRTLVTLLGIVLSVSLVTAVIEGGWSGISYVRRTGEVECGRWQGYVFHLSEEEKDAFLTREELKETAVWEEYGWNEDIYLADISGDVSSMLSLYMLEGRPPENPGEIALPVTYVRKLRSGGAEAAPGKPVSISTGIWTDSSGNRLGEFGSERPEYDRLADVHEDVWTLTGIYEDPVYPDAGTAGLPIGLVRSASGGTGYWRVFYTLKNPGAYDAFEKTLRDSGLESVPNSPLLRSYGVMGGDLVGAILSLGAVLVCLVVFGSVSLICSAFSISVEERIQQFGILKSLGATRAQIRSCVLWEALFLCIPGIPLGLAAGCGGIGITLRALREYLAVFMGTSEGRFADVRIHLVPAPVPLLLCAVVCLLTVLLSAWIPARRAMKLQPVEAVRQTGYGRSMARKRGKRAGETVKTGPLQKHLGFEWMMALRNFRRDRSRYRSTVFSLFLSVTLFISASSLCDYLSATVHATDAALSREDITVMGLLQDQEGAEDPAAMLELLSGARGVTGGICWYSAGRQLQFDADLADDEVLGWLESGIRIRLELGEDGTLRMPNTMICFTDDRTFEELCRENGVSPEQCTGGDTVSGLLYNWQGVVSQLPGGGRKWGITRLVRPSAFPLTLTGITEKAVEGYVLVSRGEDLYEYWPESCVETGADPAEDEILYLTAREALQETPFTAAAPADEVPFAFDRDGPILFYPMSSMDEVLGQVPDRDIRYQYAFTAASPAEAEADMERLLLEAGQESGGIETAGPNRDLSLEVLVRVFSWGFITLISLIAAANVFNTVSTNITIRRREFAVLRSIGMTRKAFRKMIRLECVICGLRGLLWGLPASAAVSWIIWHFASSILYCSFHIPPLSVAAAAASVFLVIFAAMVYAVRRTERDGIADVLKQAAF